MKPQGGQIDGTCEKRDYGDSAEMKQNIFIQQPLCTRQFQLIPPSPHGRL